MNRTGQATAAAAVVVLGLFSEQRAYGLSVPLLWVPDLAVGLVWTGCAVLAWRSYRRFAGVSLLFAVSWFAGGFAAPLTYLHRGPLVHVLVGYPDGRPRTRAGYFAVLVAYAAAAGWPLWRFEASGVVMAGALLAVVLVEGRFGGWLFRPRATATVVLSTVLVVSAVARSAVPEHTAVVPALLAYDVALIAVALVLFAPLGRREPARVADLVVELGESRSQPLRDALARVVGDPRLEIGYWQPDMKGYVDVTGEPVTMPTAPGTLMATRIDQGGRPYAVLLHDRALRDDPVVLNAVGRVASLIATNVELRHALQAQLDDLVRSRRRLVIAAEEERQHLGARLERGPERRLRAVLASLGADSVTSDPHLPIALTHLRQSIDDVGDIAAGLYPRELADGLHAALRALVERSPLPVVLHAEVRRCPPEVEAAGYFVCAETLANVAKHASANHAVIRVASSEDRLVIVVADDGRGGADPARGSGLAGLVDRIESLGGELSIESPAGLGTSVRVTLPLVPP